MALAQLSNIREAVRQYTRSPSEAQLSTQQLDDFINMALLYDFPSDLRLFSLRTTLNFYTQPGVDTYQTNTTDPLDPLYNFKNKYITIHPQVFMAGVPASFTQYRDVFYGQWPQTNAVVNTGLAGNGTQGPFTGIVNTAAQNNLPTGLSSPRILQKSVIFTALDTNATAMVLVDYPVSNTTGALGLPGQPQTLPSPYGQIDYWTGNYTLNFPNPTANSSNAIPDPITVEYVPYVAGKPIAMLYFNNIMTIRPVPNMAYLVQLEADIRPTELVSSTDTPDIDQWMEYIALGASLRILARRVDTETYAQLEPLWKNEQNRVNRTSLMQTANMRTQTIYTVGRSNTWGWFGSNWPF